jgi:hypothetical protein
MSNCDNHVEVLDKKITELSDALAHLGNDCYSTIFIDTTFSQGGKLC